MTRARVILYCLIAVVAAIAAYPASGTAATGGTVVGATVPSATSIDASLCATDTAATDFGLVPPGSSALTPAPCRVEFGSSNATSTLRIVQRDDGGVAMYQPTRGEFDPSWGTSGVATYAGGAPADIVTDLVAMPDGGTAAVGVLRIDSADPRMYVERRGANGSMLGSFNGGAPIISNPSAGNDALIALDAFADGSIVATGDLDDETNIRRYSASGSLAWSQTIPGADGMGMAVRVSRDQAHVYVLGTEYAGSGSNWDVFIERRLASNGTLVGSWGVGGRREFAAAYADPSDMFLYRTDLLELEDGSVLACSLRTTGGDQDGVVWKLDASGALDLAFGAGTGRITFEHGPSVQHNACVDLEALEDGSVLATSYPRTSENGLAAIKFDPSNGAIATTWGTSGWYLVPMANAVVPRSVELEDGSLRWFGLQDVAGTYEARMVGATADAQPELALGTGGIADLAGFDGPDGGIGGAADLGIDGSIFIAAGRWVGTNLDPAVARYGSSPVPDYGGGGSWGSAGGVFGSCLEDAAGAGVVAAWSEAGTCTATDDGSWNAVPDSAAGPDAIARSTTSGIGDATVDLRFGFHARTDQPPGRYLAPIAFEVVAPMV